jgi:glycerate dehydrogenase
MEKTSKQIVVLDGHTLNPGDLSWEGLERLGELRVHERTSAEALRQRAAGAEILLTNKTVLSAEDIDFLDNLEYIGVLATGCNVVDLEAASRRDIPVCNAAGYSTPSVVQMVFAYLLHFSNRVADHSHGVHAGKWEASADFCYWESEQVELAAGTLGIIGLGEIGGQVARTARAFGMRVLATTRNPDRPEPEGVRWVDADTLFEESDYLSLHCPLTPQTRGVINRKTIARMKRTAILINTGRGGLVEEQDLADALNQGRLAGAAVDVLQQEPPAAGSPLIGARNCLLTPHIAWATRASRKRLMRITEENLTAFLEGTPRNRVN